MIALLAGLHIAFGAIGRPLDKELSLEIKATSVDRVLQQISDASGQHLECDPHFVDRIVLVSVSRVPVRTLMDHLADALDADWARASTGYRLEASPAKEKLTAKAVFDLRASQIGSAIGRLIPKTQTPFDSVSSDRLAVKLAGLYRSMQANPQNPTLLNQFDSASLDAPYKRACTRLFCDLPVSELAAMSEEERVVFTADPTSMQRALGPHSAEILGTMIKEHRTWSESVRRSDAPREFHGHTTPGPLLDPDLPPLPKLRFIVHRYGDSFQCLLELAVDKTSVPLSAMNLSIAPPAAQPGANK
jgi:hypothetical protein